MTQPSKSAMREAIRERVKDQILLLDGVSPNGFTTLIINAIMSIFEQFETEALAELESRLPEKWPNGDDEFKYGGNVTLDQVHAAFDAFREEQGLTKPQSTNNDAISVQNYNDDAMTNQGGERDERD